MVEAMDDSYLFATSLPGLQFFCLQMERFQYSYNWLTQWSKTSVFILQDSSLSAEMIPMPSITRTPGKNPWNITYHPVNVIHGQLEMLRTFVNDSTSRFQAISDFIDDFPIPKFTVRPPITLLRKITMQNIASRARAMLALQPIKQKDAERLDHKLSAKIHGCLGFPFRPNSDILFLPVKHMGFDFPSIAKINLSLAIEGLARDLNHHIMSYQKMARITLADWRCSINDCVNPIDSHGLQRKYSRFTSKLPVAWIEAHSGLGRVSLHLRCTDYSFLSEGQVSLSHLSKLRTRDGQHGVHGKTIKSLRKQGFHWVNQVGFIDRNYKLNISQLPQTTGGQNTKLDSQVKPIWARMREVLQGTDMTSCADGPNELLLHRETRQRMAENTIKALALISPLRPSNTKSEENIEVWASDGSMRPATAGPLDRKITTCAVTGPKTLVLWIRDQNSSILQGELMGMISSSILASDGITSNIFSDHMNTTRLIDDHQSGSNTNAKLRYMPGRSYYRWLIDLVDRKTTSKIQYTPGHAKDTSSTAARLNFEADHYASHGSTASLAAKLYIAPTPTFYMDEFSWHSDKMGWIESNIKPLVTSLIDREIANTLGSGHRFRVATWLYDGLSPPSYPYTRSASAFSAAVQLYARSGQLPTADNLRNKRIRVSNLCRFGCNKIEDVHHIFTNCPLFTKLREDASKEVDINTASILEKETGISKELEMELRNIAKSLFSDCHQSWPLARTQYYLGFVPKFKHCLEGADLSYLKRNRLTNSIHTTWHTVAIRLAGRIWGDTLRRIASQETKHRAH